MRTRVRLQRTLRSIMAIIGFHHAAISTPNLDRLSA
jgi:hypothetical protein